MNNNDAARTMLRQWLKKENLNYLRLSDKLKQIGVDANNIVLANKVNRGTFKFSFVLQICEALGKDVVLIDRDDKGGARGSA